MFGIIIGIWFLAIGAYSFYYAYMMKQTNTIKPGWFVSKNIQLKESRDIPAFIEAVGDKTRFFAAVTCMGGILIIVFQLIRLFTGILCCMIVLMGMLGWYSSMVRKAEIRYLAAPLKKKTKNTKNK